MDQKERYIVKLHDGTRLNVLASTFKEIIEMYGEENVEEIKKMEYEGDEQE